MFPVYAHSPAEWHAPEDCLCFIIYLTYGKWIIAHKDYYDIRISLIHFIKKLLLVRDEIYRSPVYLFLGIDHRIMAERHDNSFSLSSCRYRFIYSAPVFTIIRHHVMHIVIQLF